MNSIVALVLIFMLLPCIVFAEKVELITGETLQGNVIEKTSDTVVLQHPILGRLEIPADKIRPVAPTPESELPRWISQVELGFSGSRGNTEEYDLRGAFRTRRKTDLHHWKIDTVYRYGSDEDTTTKNDLTFEILKEWLKPESPWLYFALGRYDYDRFESWDHRVSVSGGAGYELIESQNFDFTLRGGAGLVKEFGSDEDDITPEGLLGFNLEWRMTETQNIAAETIFYPALSDVGEYRAVSSASWTVDLDDKDLLKFKCGIENEYESEVGQDVQHNDFSFYSALVALF